VIPTLLALALVSAAPAEPVTTDAAAVPTATYGSDEGFGTGGVGTLYWRQPGKLPYAAALTLNIFITTRLIQAHRVRLDLVRPFDLPVRVLAQVGYYSTVTQNFCGYGNTVTCGTGLAEDAANASGHPVGSADYDLVLKKHHQMRFVRPYAEVLGRYFARDKPHRLELFAGWRGNLYIPGEIVFDDDWFLEGPYEGSQWALHDPEGEPGFSSVVQLGAAWDDRDKENWPTKGYFVEASARAALPLLGSDWLYAGGNVTGAVYVPLLDGPSVSGPDVVLAHRVVGDVLFGDVPTEDLARLGGLTDFISFGGSDVGRGVREHRYLGKVKVMAQTELRWSFAEASPLDQDLRFALAGFADAAWVGYDVSDWRGDALRAVAGFGTGFRLLWNKNFAIRLDVGFSPHERYEPRVYIRVGDPF
jgi:hypothetical protein